MTDMKMQYSIRSIIKATAVIAVALCFLYAVYSPKPLFEPACVPKETSCGDFTGKLERSGRLVVYSSSASAPVFESSPKLYIYDFLLYDFTGDGSCDLAFALWKRGSFGSSRPFWHKSVELSDFTKSPHLFAYELKGSRFKPSWCSSDLPVPIESISVTGDLNEAGLPILHMPPRSSAAPGYARYWVWSGGWGFSGE